VAGTGRKLLIGFFACLLGWAIWGRPAPEAVEARPAVASDPSPPAGVETSEYDELYAAFAADLEAFRRGEDARLDALQSNAARLARDHGRDDAPRVVDFYADLSARERRLGRAAYDDFVVIWERVADHAPADWERDRADYLRELEELAARVLPAADFVPAGRALALAARLEVEHLASMTAQDPERGELLASAERHLREALAVFQRAGQETPQLHPLWQQGKLELLRGADERARRRFEVCAELARRVRVDDYRERALVGLIGLARRRGDAHRLRELLDRLASFRRPEECWELTRAYALHLLHRDEAERAAEFLIRHRPADPGALDAWRHVLALVRLRLEDFEGARGLLERLRGRGRKAEDLLLLQATLDLELSDSAAVLDALDRPPSELPEMSERGRSRAAVLVGEAHLVEGRPRAALEALERARDIADGWEARLEEQLELETTSASIMGEWLGLHAVVLEARALIDLDRAFEAALVIETAHGARWRGDGARGERLEADDLRAWAAASEHGLVTWVLGADSGAVVHVSPTGEARGQAIARKRSELERGARRLRGALLSGQEARATRLGEELAAAVLPDALRERLLAAEASDGRLLCLAHGEVERLPLEALPLGDESSGSRLLDELAALAILPELPARRPGTAPSMGATWQLLGAPLDGAGRPRLPAAREELGVLADLLPGAALHAGPGFRRRAVLDALSSGDCLHLATHLERSEACDSPRYAPVGLELSGGDLLCAREVAELGCRAPLVVLAACETAEGRQLDARGLQGVARAFLASGTRNLLVTLWPIRDEVAREFTPLFHEALLEGLGPARAARRARRALAESGVPAAEWAAYRVIGRD